MSYLGLARKYRPQTFEEVVGQQEIATTLQNAIRSNCVHHAYLFAGSRGVGKTSMARLFAKSLNCEKGPTLHPCNQCEICQRISTGEDIDVVEIDGASNRGIDEIRNIKENIKYMTSRARFKIFIIDEVHMLTQAAFNALLKTLEEPPQHVKFILATTQITSIPDTILSRCQRFVFKALGVREISRQIERVASLEKLQVETEALELIALAAGGAMRDSLVLLEQIASYSGGHVTKEAIQRLWGNMGEEGIKIVEALHAKNGSELLSVIRDFLAQGGDPSYLVNKLLQELRDILVAQATKDADSLIEGTSEYRKWVTLQTSRFTLDFLTMAIYHLLEAKQLIHKSLAGRIVIETTLLKLIRAESLVPLKKIAETLSGLEDRIHKAGVGRPATLPKELASSGSHPKVGPSKNSTDDIVPPSVLVGLDLGETMAAIPRTASSAATASPATTSLPTGQASGQSSGQASLVSPAMLSSPMPPAPTVPAVPAEIPATEWEENTAEAAPEDAGFLAFQMAKPVPLSPASATSVAPQTAVERPQLTEGKDNNQPAATAAKVATASPSKSGKSVSRTTVKKPSSKTIELPAIPVMPVLATEALFTTSLPPAKPATKAAEKTAPVPMPGDVSVSGSVPKPVIPAVATESLLTISPAAKPVAKTPEPDPLAIPTSVALPTPPPETSVTSPAPTTPAAPSNPWEGFLQHLTSKLTMQAELLRKEAHGEVIGQHLVIRLPQQFRMAAQLLSQPNNRPFVYEGIVKNFGRSVSLQFEFTGEASPPAPARRPEDRTKDQPLVKKTLELFEGHVVQVAEITAENVEKVEKNDKIERPESHEKMEKIESEEE